MITPKYISETSEDISNTLSNLGCQPILFIGSGLSQRYFNAPTWDQLLQIMATDCPAIDKTYAYYKQGNPNLIDIGTIFADKYRDWAWESGRSEFDDELFDTGVLPDIYLKSKVAELFESITPKSLDEIVDTAMKAEILALQNIQPHSVITTNYDRFLEVVFPDYEPIIGQQVLHSNHTSIGEIFKIHGCASIPESLVLTRKDYDEFEKKKKYLSAKLFTFFAEHPLLLVGYNAQDPNITSILSDIDELLSEDGQLIENIYILQREPDFSRIENHPPEKLINVGHGRSVRVRCITSSSFEWVFKAFGSTDNLDKVNPKLLRSLLARTYDLVRRDIPRRVVDVDFLTLQHAIETQADFAKLFGITSLNDPSSLNLVYPYSLSSVGIKLGYRSWHGASKLIEKIKDDKDIDLKSFDNKYHIAIMNGNVAQTHRYSEAIVDLLMLVRDGKEYEIDGVS